MYEGGGGRKAEKQQARHGLNHLKPSETKSRHAFLRFPFAFAQGRSGFRLRAQTPAERLNLRQQGKISFLFEKP